MEKWPFLLITQNFSIGTYNVPPVVSIVQVGRMHPTRHLKVNPWCLGGTFMVYKISIIFLYSPFKG